MTNDDADNNGTTQAKSNSADNDNASADVDAMTKTMRFYDNQPEKRHGRPWQDEVAVAVAVDVECG